MEIKPIGHIRSCYTQKFATPRQSGLVPSATGVLEMLPFVQPEDSLDGIEGFSHLWLIFGFHQNTNLNFKSKILPPRSPDQKIGVYATRSPHRWNPLGLSLVKLEKREGHLLYLSGIDVIDETPVYDIKPYLPETEAVPLATAGWQAEMDFEAIEVEFSPEMQEGLTESEQRLITETLRLDPRPKAYKNAHEEHLFVAEISGRQIQFKCLNSKRFLVLNVLK